MDITRIKINGFKNLKEIELNLSNITSLLSINSFGKTNTLEALIFGIDFIVRNNEIKINQMNYEPAIPLNINNLNDTFSFELEAKLNGKEIIYGYSFLWHKDKIKPRIVNEYLKIKDVTESQKFTYYIKRVEQDAKYKPSKTAICNKTINIDDYSLVINKMQAYDELYYIDVINSLNKLKIFVDSDFDAIKPYGITPIFKGKNYDYDLLNNNIPTILYDIKNKRPDRYNLIINTFKDIFPTIQEIDTIEIPIISEQNIDLKNIESSEVAGKFYALVVKDSNLSKAINFSSMSDGARRILKVLTNLEIALSRGCSIVAIEEPENSLNPRILQQYLIALNSFAKDLKIIITSHSPYLVNYIDPSNMYIGLPNNKGIAKFSKIKNKYINKLMNDANDLDLNVGEYIFDLMSGDESDIDTLIKYME